MSRIFANVCQMHLSCCRQFQHKIIIYVTFIVCAQFFLIVIFYERNKTRTVHSRMLGNTSHRQGADKCSIIMLLNYKPPRNHLPKNNWTVTVNKRISLALSYIWTPVFSLASFIPSLLALATHDKESSRQCIHENAGKEAKTYNKAMHARIFIVIVVCRRFPDP